MLTRIAQHNLSNSSPSVERTQTKEPPNDAFPLRFSSPPDTRFYPIISFFATKAEIEAALSSTFAQALPPTSLSLFSDMFLSAEHAKAKESSAHMHICTYA